MDTVAELPSPALQARTMQAATWKPAKDAQHLVPPPLGRGQARPRMTAIGHPGGQHQASAFLVRTVQQRCMGLQHQHFLSCAQVGAMVSTPLAGTHASALISEVWTSPYFQCSLVS
jgi:hypothetical protein